MGNGVLFNIDDALGENESKQTPWLNFNSYFIRITYLLLEQNQRYILVADMNYMCIILYNCVDTIQANNVGIFGFR